MNIDESQFMAFEDVRRSGATNMFDTEFVEVLSGLSREEQSAIRKDYSNLKKKYLTQGENEK